MTDPALHLTALEARVLGVLIEKEITTPDQYPLSLNSLRLACNQKSNRDPFMEIDEATVQSTVDDLTKRFLVVEASGSRVPRYRQALCGAEHAKLVTSVQERAILCELLVRGPQTTGELRSRAQRMAPFPALSDVDATLQQLMNREGGAVVERLARTPGSSAIRYGQLLTSEPPAAPVAPSVIQAIAASPSPAAEPPQAPTAEASPAPLVQQAAPSVAAFALPVSSSVPERAGVRPALEGLVSLCLKQSGDAAADTELSPEPAKTSDATGHETRISALEATVEALRAELSKLCTGSPKSSWADDLHI